MTDREQALALQANYPHNTNKGKAKKALDKIRKGKNGR